MRRILRTLILLFALGGLTASSCNPSDSSPPFDENELITISGRYLDANGDPLANTNIHLKNLRRFGFIDYTEAVITEAVNLFTFTIFTSAWPFYWYYGEPEPIDSDTYRERPDYFLEDVKTDENGEFSFRIRAGNFIRDVNNGINIDLVNDSADDDPLLGKFAFVVQEKDTELGDLQLCDLGGVEMSESSDEITFSWDTPENEVEQYVVNLGLSSNNSLIWSTEVDGTSTSVSIAKTVVGSLEARVGVEAFYQYEGKPKVSCLSSVTDFTVNSPLSSKAEGVLATAENIDFYIDSLTNNHLDDKIFFDAFNTTWIEIDLGETTNFSSVVLHNLKVRDASAEMVDVIVKDNEGSTVYSKEFDEQRFMDLDLGETVTGRTLRLSFTSTVVDLQEVTVF